MTLTAGVKYPIRMEFFENGGWGQAQASGDYPGQAQSVVPNAHSRARRPRAKGTLQSPHGSKKKKEAPHPPRVAAGLAILAAAN